MTKRVLVLEDDDSLRLVITKALTRAGYEVRATASPDSAVDRMLRGDADVLVADVLLGKENFLDRLGEIARARPGAPVIVMSAQTTAATAISAEKGGAFEYLPKPFDLDDLAAVVARAAGREAPATRGREQTGFAGLIGRSPAMQDAFKAIGRLAQVRAPVLFTGPDGAGRASAARTLHAAAFGEGAVLIEAGPARLEREGAAVFAEARGEGLLLRRAERWSEAVQDLVQEELERPDPGPARVYATAAPDPASQGLRRALADMLGAGRVVLPPLRERGEDKQALFEHVLRKHDRVRLSLEPEALALIDAHPWPGEVRELERVASTLALQGPRETITLQDLRAALTPPGGGDPGEALRRAASAYAAARLAEGVEDLHGEASAQLDRALIEAALAACNGVRRDAAARLGLNRNTLARRMAALGLDDAD